MKFNSFKIFHLNKTLMFIVIVLNMMTLHAQNTGKRGDVFVDDQGVMRWGITKEEVKGFGVNYTAPFAHVYRTAGKLGVDLKKAIDNDVYHFARLGFDLYRIHVWDTEISDAEGNLLENEHLELFDYLISKLKERNINFVVTPIAFWGNGWPELDEETPGFSHKYGKAESLINPAAIKAQENYLNQFLEHKNKYTGVAYKNDPNLIAFEISNEPHHKGSPDEVTSFIKKMIASMRNTGTKKPIFYNISHSVHLAESYFDAGIQGGTFQWYPTGLGFGKELEGNLLPNVNDYNIPFNDVIKKNHGAKLVYEFDAADTYKSYLYPAMARSFRSAGIQIATQFAYDPTFMAATNTEYNTHYMNLAYVPKKALALMITSKVFHEIPMNKDFGTYPENKSFGNFKIDEQNDLAVYNSKNAFYYTHSNDEEVKELKHLRHIAGLGNSRLVEYDGKGAYFLDKIENGIWRLEVMPDAILVDNPFGKNSLKKVITVINWKEGKMKLNLPDLAEDISIKAINEANEYQPKVRGKLFNIKPGVYILKRKAIDKNIDLDMKIDNIGLAEFSAPATSLDSTYLIHTPPAFASAGENLVLRFTIATPKKIEKAQVLFQNNNIYETVELSQVDSYTYEAEVPTKILVAGYLNYRVVLSFQDSKITYPEGVVGDPFAWDNYHDTTYKIAVLDKAAPISLFNARTDHEKIVGEWRKGNKLVPYANGLAGYQIHLPELFKEDVENKNAAPIYDYSIRYNFSEKIKERRADLKDQNKLIVEAHSLGEKNEKVQVAFVDKNGAAFGKIIELKPEVDLYEIEFSELNPVRTVTLPRPYPSFLPYYFEHDETETFNIENAEALQISIGPGLSKDEQLEPHHIEITSFRLEK